MNLDAARKTYRMKYLVILLIFCVICLFGLILIELLIPPSSLFRGGFTALVSSLTVASILGIVYEYFLREDIMKMNDASSDRVIEKLRVSNFSQDIGLSGVFPNANSYDYSDFLLSSREATIVMNDGRTWVSNHEADIEDRLSSKELITNFILINPTSPFLDSLAIKIGTSRKALSEKIIETTKTLKSHHNKNFNNLKIFYHNNPTTFSLFFCEEKARIVTYPIARKSDKVPLFVFKNGDEDFYYHSINRDIKTLLQSSSQVYPELPLLAGALDR